MVKVTLKRQAVASILARKNKSQNWLAGRLGISSGYMSQLLNGERAPSPRMRDRILEYFESMSFDDLFSINA